MLYGLIGSNVLMIAAFIFRYNQLPPQVPLFYSRTPGDEQLADIWMLIFLPLFMNLFFFLNLWVNKKFFFQNPLVNKIVLYANLFITIIFTLIFIKIVFFIS